MTGQSLGATLKQMTSISFERLGRTILNYKTPAVILKCAYGFMGMCGNGGGKHNVAEVCSCLNPTLFHSSTKLDS